MLVLAVQNNVSELEELQMALDEKFLEHDEYHDMWETKRIYYYYYYYYWKFLESDCHDIDIVIDFVSMN